MHNDSWMTLVRHINLLLLIIIASCGKGFKEEGIKQQEETYTGLFQARLESVNRKFGIYRGQSAIAIEDNQFWTRIKVTGPRTDDMHAQYIHVGSRCPDMSDDLNDDGILDFMESYRVVGPILIPLDSNLNSQQKGLNEFPVMKRHAFYYYSEASNYQRLVEDLRREDVIENDLISKLNKGEDLSLGNRVLVIYGVDKEIKLPPTVSSYDGYPGQYSLPIACGKLSIGHTNAFDL